MPVRSDVDVDSASFVCVADRLVMSENPYQFLKDRYVPVGKNRGNQFAFLTVGSRNAHILLEFPFPSAFVPCGPGAVTVSSVRVLVSACSEKIGCKLGSLFPCNVIHLNLDPDGLLFHFLNLDSCFFVHLNVPSFLVVFPFGRYIFALCGTYIQLIRSIMYTKIFRVVCVHYGSINPAILLRFPSFWNSSPSTFPYRLPSGMRYDPSGFPTAPFWFPLHPFRQGPAISAYSIFRFPQRSPSD